MKAIRLQTEYLTEPLGLGLAAPRFSWNCEAVKIQSAYRIEVKQGNELLWDSGKVTTSRMLHIP